MKQAFLTYNEWAGDLHKGINLDHKGLTAKQIQEAIDNYTAINKPVALSKGEVPWVTWQVICVKFGLDPSKTKNIVLYITRAREG